MKKTIFLLCVFVQAAIGGSSAAWGDDLAMAATLPATTQTVLGGVVKSVSLADTGKGTASEIIVTDATKKLVNILITSTTTLWDEHAKAITLDKVSPKSRINAVYLTTAEGINIGQSIKILK
jgi:hypothetical protein